MKEVIDHISLIENLVNRLRKKFPYIHINENEGAPVEKAYDLPVQDGLSIELHINLQNEDELHLNVGRNFWCEWFPCSEEKVVRDFYNSVEGFISGKYRCIEFYKGKVCYKSILQKKNNEGWKPVARSIHVSRFSWPWERKTQRILSNTEPVAGGDATR